MSRRGRQRLLNAEERALWHHVVRSVAPLRPLLRKEVLPESVIAPEPPPEPPPPAPAARAEKPAPRTPVKPPPLASLEPRMKRRLSRGAEVDARLDLHGLTQAAAHRRLQMFILEAQSQGYSLVLVITGKGDPEGFASLGVSARGVLRRAVPLWLAEPALRGFVVGFETAARRHGGEGALYIRIRRRRDGGREA